MFSYLFRLLYLRGLRTNSGFDKKRKIGKSENRSNEIERHQELQFE